MRLIKLLFILALTFAVSSLIVARMRMQAPNQLALVDREGHRTVLGTVPGRTFAPRVSPDGKEVVFDTQDDSQLWIAKLSDVGAKRRLSTGGSNRGPLWSADGKRIFYITDYQNEEALFWRAADGSGTPEFLSKPVRAPESRSPQNALLSFITLKSGGDYDVWTYSLTTKQRTPLIVVPGTPQHSSHFSPDGKWIAYVSAETGQLEVYVRPFPAGTPAVRISRSGGGHPLWSPDQKELFFDNSSRMYATAINASGPFTAATPKELPIQGFIQGPLRRQYDLMPDGKQFLMMFPGGR
jgi:Tol biopolymer transport system component